MGIAYRIECYSTERITEDSLRSRLGVDKLDNENYTIEIENYDKIHFREQSSNDTSRVALAKVIEIALLHNDAVVITKDY